MKTVCYYHKADLDGICSGAIVKKFIPDCEMIGVDYGDNMIPPKGTELVFYVDISPNPEDWYHIGSKGVKRKIIYIDHHKKAIKIALNCFVDIRNCSTDKAACQLVWEYFTNESLPESVRWIAKYDIWNFDEEKEDILDFQYGLKAQPDYKKLTSMLWNSLLNDIGSAAIGFQGKIIRKYLELNTTLDEELTLFIPEPMTPGYRFAVVLNQYPKYHVQEKAKEFYKDQKEYDGIAYIQMNKNGFYISLRRLNESDDIDVSEVARLFGGGGHPAAAGFKIRLDKLKKEDEGFYIVKENS